MRFALFASLVSFSTQKVYTFQLAEKHTYTRIQTDKKVMWNEFLVAYFLLAVLFFQKKRTRRKNDNSIPEANQHSILLPVVFRFLFGLLDAHTTPHTYVQYNTVQKHRTEYTANLHTYIASRISAVGMGLNRKDSMFSVHIVFLFTSLCICIFFCFVSFLSLSSDILPVY